MDTTACLYYSIKGRIMQGDFLLMFVNRLEYGLIFGWLWKENSIPKRKENRIPGAQIAQQTKNRPRTPMFLIGLCFFVFNFLLLSLFTNIFTKVSK